MSWLRTLWRGLTGPHAEDFPTCAELVANSTRLKEQAATLRKARHTPEEKKMDPTNLIIHHRDAGTPEATVTFFNAETGASHRYTMNGDIVFKFGQPPSSRLVGDTLDQLRNQKEGGTPTVAGETRRPIPDHSLFGDAPLNDLIRNVFGGCRCEQCVAIRQATEDDLFGTIEKASAENKSAAYARYADACAPDPVVPDADRELERLERSVESTQELVSALLSKLGRLLPESVATPDDSKAEPAAGTPLGREFQALRNQAEGTNHVLRYILASLGI